LIPRDRERVNAHVESAALANRRRIPATMPRSRSILLSIPAGIGMTAALAWPTAADAREPKRKGLQAETVVGVSACIPGAADCKSESESEGGTRLSGGFGIDLGWRVHPVFLVGAGYTAGWFNPTWRVDGQRIYDNAFQQGVFGVLRAYIPIWRIDIGLELSPGWSRQSFVAASPDARTYSQGFALRPGASVDFRLFKRMFIGARVDFILAFHKQLCEMQGDDRNCAVAMDVRQLPAHQVIGGVHFGVNI
jgi:hypothetical protein